MAGMHNLSFATYNLHGLNQGLDFLKELCGKNDFVFVQEHWLAPFDLSRLYDSCDDTICFASSAMDAVVSRGCLCGRPFGGVAVFVNKSFGNVTRLVKASSRYMIVQVGDVLLLNVYLPGVSTPNRTVEFIDCLANILNYLSDLQYSYIIFGGDMNIDLDVECELCTILKNFCDELELRFVSDKLLPNHLATYRVEATGASSTIDYFAVSRDLYMSVLAVDVIDSGINLSDHCPVILEVSIPRINKVPRTIENNNKHQLPVYR